MDINRFTQKAQEAISSAQTKASRYSHQQVDVEHLLASLLDQDNGLAISIFTKAGIGIDGFQRRVVQELERMPKVSQGAGAAEHIYITVRLSRLLAQAEDEAK
jgi:ATP-dependent Clp protease ATP-binding subunit ClpB